MIIDTDGLRLSAIKRNCFLLFPSRHTNSVSSPDIGRWKLPTRPSRSFTVRFFSFQKSSIPIHSSNNRHFGVSGDYYSRRRVWDQRLQNARYPSDDCSRRNRILLGYLHISLCARDDTTIGKGKHLYYRCRNNAEDFPAKSSALACCVSARFDFYQWTYAHRFPSHILAQWK